MLLRSQLWAQVWAHGGTHTSPSCAHHSKPGLCRHAHGHAQTPGTPANTHSLLHGKHLPPTPPAVRILYLCRDHSLGNPLLPEPTFPKPVSSHPVQFLHLPLPRGLSHPEAHGVRPGPVCGEGEEAKIASLPPRLSSLPTSALGSLPPSFLWLPPNRRLPPTPVGPYSEGWGGLGRI